MKKVQNRKMESRAAKASKFALDFFLSRRAGECGDVARERVTDSCQLH